MAKNQKKGGNRSFQDDYYIEPPQVYDYDRQRQSAPPAGRSRAGWKRRQRAAQKQPRRYSVPPQEEDHSRQARRDLQRRKRRRRAARVLTFFAIAFLLAVLVFITLVFVFSVQEVRVSGNTMYTAEQVSAASGVETGDKLLLLHTGEIGETLEKNLPYIRRAQVKRVLPNTVEITVEESQPGFAVDRGDGTYTLLDDDFKVDIQDNGQNYSLKADLPGVQKEDLKVDFADGILTISAEHHSSKEDKDEKGYLLRERVSGSYSRSFSFEDADESKIDAEFSNGVLTMTIGKKEPQKKATSIAIK